MSKSKKVNVKSMPDQRPLTKMQANRLAAVSGVAAKELVGLSVTEISEKYKVVIDPTLLFFRKICGRVVKKDPATGVEYPVPFATVHVEDTDCGLLSFAPPSSSYLWFFPFYCHREEIATVVTDECGRFCVYVPRWEIDWILKWRKERICFPDIFNRPRIKDILDNLLPRPPEPPWPPRPEPDPVPWLLRDGGLALERARDVLGDPVVDKLALLAETAVFGQDASAMQQLIEAPAFTQPIPPPLPAKISARANNLEADTVGQLDSETLETLTSDMVTTAKDMKALANVRLNRYIGPFWRCVDVLIPEWSRIVDVPDITFRVTQDVDNDGDEETIYSEGYFDVRWDSGNIPDVVLEASEIAVASEVCHPDIELPCEEPAIVMAGHMPLHNPDPIPYHNQTTGYAKRPNRPHPTGGFATPPLSPSPPASLLASTPYTGTIQLYGCNQHDGAVYYRLRYRFNGSAPQTFSGHSWKQFRWIGSPGHLDSLVVTPDANGWYEILSPADWPMSHWLLNWPTKNYQNGLYDIYMELGNNSKTVIHTTPAIALRVDNTWASGFGSAGAVAQFTSLAWRVEGETDADWKPLSFTCPVIRRPAGKAVEVKIAVQVATPHLRSIELWGRGCGGGKPLLQSGLPALWELVPGGNGMRHWHTSAADNSFANAGSPAIFKVPSSALSGAYTFHLRGRSRAFNPAGGDGGIEADWFYNPVYNGRHPTVAIAIVDAC